MPRRIRAVARPSGGLRTQPWFALRQSYGRDGLGFLPRTNGRIKAAAPPPMTTAVAAAPRPNNPPAPAAATAAGRSGHVLITPSLAGSVLPPPPFGDMTSPVVPFFVRRVTQPSISVTV